MENKVISSAPHIRRTLSTTRIMQLVIVALIPTIIVGVLNFGPNVLLHLLVCAVTCLLTEFTIQAFADLPLTAGNWSPIVTGVLLALSLPVNAPLWAGAAGGFFAIAFVKILGQNRLNAALAARCFLQICFSGTIGFMADYACDAYSGATPLSVLKAGQVVDPFPMMIGNIGGSMGETSAIAILAGGIILLAFGIIRLRIPLTSLITFSLMLIFFGGKGFDEVYFSSQICGGGLMLAVWFMATDYASSPITSKGQYVYGALIGILTAVFRLWGSTAEGVAYAILLANLLVPLIEKVTLPKTFGKKKQMISR